MIVWRCPYCTESETEADSTTEVIGVLYYFICLGFCQWECTVSITFLYVSVLKLTPLYGEAQTEDVGINLN